MINVLVDCSKDLGKLVTLVKNIYGVLIIITPVILILGGMLDFFKAVIAQKPDEMEKSKHKFINRIITACAVFLLLAAMQLITNILASAGVSSSEWLACWGLKN